MRNKEVMKWKFLHCFEKKVLGLTHYSLHTTHYTTILITDINGLLWLLIFQIGDYYFQKYQFIWLF